MSRKLECLFKHDREQIVEGYIEGENSSGDLAVRSKLTKVLHFCPKNDVYVSIETLESEEKKLHFKEW